MTKMCKFTIFHFFPFFLKVFLSEQPAELESLRRLRLYPRVLGVPAGVQNLGGHGKGEQECMIQEYRIKEDKIQEYMIQEDMV